MMNNPAVKSMMSDPEALGSMMKNPEMASMYLFKLI
jgi:hypothetical protein